MTESVCTNYGFGVKMNADYDVAVVRAKAALKEEGFGVLTEIDVKRTLKEKLDAEFRRYVILGACNPPLAYQAFQKELQIGLLLPCNVIVYEDGAGSVVMALDPEAALGVAGRQDLGPLAREAKDRLQRALGSL